MRHPRFAAREFFDMTTPNPPPSATTNDPASMPAMLRREDFVDLDAPLRVVLPGGDFPLMVVSTQALPEHALRSTPPFSILLRGPRERALPQGTYTIDHPSLGRVELFLVPVGQGAATIDYEAIFN